MKLLDGTHMHTGTLKPSVPKQRGNFETFNLNFSSSFTGLRGKTGYRT